ncbi:hypothetical protein [Nonomuraea dietziae]|uniref:hypothetical protein n=1 Tax=Nonomuraea dietziae TaxID=65515 RepID=UPI0034086058
MRPSRTGWRQEIESFDDVTASVARPVPLVDGAARLDEFTEPGNPGAEPVTPG